MHVTVGSMKFHAPHRLRKAIAALDGEHGPATSERVREWADGVARAAARSALLQAVPMAIAEGEAVELPEAEEDDDETDDN